MLDHTENPGGIHEWLLITTHRIRSTNLHPCVTLAELVNDQTRVALVRESIGFRIDDKVRISCIIGSASRGRVVLSLMLKMQEMLRKRFSTEPERACLAPLNAK